MATDNLQEIYGEASRYNRYLNGLGDTEPQPYRHTSSPSPTNLSGQDIKGFFKMLPQTRPEHRIPVANSAGAPSRPASYSWGQFGIRSSLHTFISPLSEKVLMEA